MNGGQYHYYKLHSCKTYYSAITLLHILEGKKPATFRTSAKFSSSYIVINLIYLVNRSLFMNLTQVCVEIPYVFIQTICYTIIVYPMVGFEGTVTKVGWFFFVNFFTFLYFIYYGMMTVSITPNHQLAAIVSSTFFALFNLFSGFYIPKPVSSFIYFPIKILTTN